MAKVAKNQRAQSMGKSALENAPENAAAKVKANDKRKMKAFEKVQDKVSDKTQDNVSANGGFDVVLGLIHAARARAVTAVNTTLIELYWSIGQYISRKAAKDGWGTGTVAELSRTIQRKYPGMMGYSVQNLWRMRQFYEAYQGQAKLSTVLRVLSWSHNMAILSRCKRKEEREFYLRLAHREHWTFRELQRQLAGALFERTVLAQPKMSAALAGAISNKLARQAITARQTE